MEEQALPFFQLLSLSAALKSQQQNSYLHCGNKKNISCKPSSNKTQRGSMRRVERKRSKSEIISQREKFKRNMSSVKHSGRQKQKLEIKEKPI